jgi:uncharacterized ubiquitin-like protein YukD
MTNPIIKLVNATTGEEVERPMNSKELEVWEQDKIDSQARDLEQIRKVKARLLAEEKLLALGLTTEDLKALLG